MIAFHFIIMNALFIYIFAAAIIISEYRRGDMSKLGLGMALILAFVCCGIVSAISIQVPLGG